MSEHVYLIQRGLQRAGYYSGPMDGQWNARVDTAMGRLRLARGEPLDPCKPFNGLETQPESSGA